MGISETSDHIQIKFNMPNPSQEPVAPSKAPKEDLNDMYVLCTFKIKIESQNLLSNLDGNLLWGLAGCWMFPTGVWNLDLDLDMISGLWFNPGPSFGSLH